MALKSLKTGTKEDPKAEGRDAAGRSCACSFLRSAFNLLLKASYCLHPMNLRYPQNVKQDRPFPFASLDLCHERFIFSGEDIDGVFQHPIVYVRLESRMAEFCTAVRAARDRSSGHPGMRPVRQLVRRQNMLESTRMTEGVATGDKADRMGVDVITNGTFLDRSVTYK